MKKRTVVAVFAGVLVGALSSFICYVEGLFSLMGLGDKLCGNYESLLVLIIPLLLISGTAGFYFPFAWLLRRGSRADDVKFLFGAIGRIVSSLLFASVFFGGWLAATDSVMSLVPEALRIIYMCLIPVVTAAGFTVGIWMVERLGGTRKTRFLHIFIWPLAGCTVGAVPTFLIGPLMFSFGTASLVLREVQCWKQGEGVGSEDERKRR